MSWEMIMSLIYFQAEHIFCDIHFFPSNPEHNSAVALEITAEPKSSVCCFNYLFPTVCCGNYLTELVIDDSVLCRESPRTPNGLTHLAAHQVHLLRA